MKKLYLDRSKFKIKNLIKLFTTAGYALGGFLIFIIVVMILTFVNAPVNVSLGLILLIIINQYIYLYKNYSSSFKKIFVFSFYFALYYLVAFKLYFVYVPYEKTYTWLESNLMIEVMYILIWGQTFLIMLLSGLSVYAIAKLLKLDKK